MDLSKPLYCLEGRVTDRRGSSLRLRRLDLSRVPSHKHYTRCHQGHVGQLPDLKPFSLDLQTYVPKIKVQTLRADILNPLP